MKEATSGLSCNKTSQLIPLAYDYYRYRN